MNNLILFDSEHRDHMLPLTFTRPVADIRIGILTIREKWSLWMDGEVSFITQDYLSEKYPIRIEDQNWVINGGLLPNEVLIRKIKQLQLNEALMDQGELLAARMPEDQFNKLMAGEELDDLIGYEIKDTPYIQIKRPWDIFVHNAEAIETDFRLLTRGRSSMPINGSNKLIEGDNIFVEEGAKIDCAILNASEGPIYIGKYSHIMEGSIIRGPFAILDHATVKMGAKIYGPTTVGPYCKVGGEVNNAVFFGFSNKAHDGFIGNSVIGQWCNLGADTNSSNLKNNYTEVKLWSYPEERFVKTGRQFVGLIMGDHSKCGINTMFNTGTIVGVSANVFGDGYQRNFIPSFSWGGKQNLTTYKFEDALDTMDRVMARRDKYLNETERNIYAHIFEQSKSFRSWEKKTNQ
jgi:UDP-N-acetylglucosamine diphosphorylase/glucosamine-1-phosphate N-acetyltransferase